MSHSIKIDSIDCKGLILLQFFLFSIFGLYGQTGNYWNQITKAEDYFYQEKTDSSLTSYLTTFRKFGIRHMDNWYNAVYISQETEGFQNYTDSLIQLLIEEDNVYTLKLLDTKSKRITQLQLISDTISKKAYVKTAQRKKIEFREWKKLEKKDQRIRKFPLGIFVSNKKLGYYDSINRQTFYTLYAKSDSCLPNKLDFWEFEMMEEPYWVIFQHSYFDWKSSDSPEPLKKIILDELSKGSISPKGVQYCLIYSVLRDIDVRKIDLVYKDSQKLLADWFKVVNFGSMTDLLKEVNEDELKFINQLRTSIGLEEITDFYLGKRKKLKEYKLYVR